MVIIGNLEKITIGGTGKFFSKVKFSLVISTTFEFFCQKVDTIFFENGQGVSIHYITSIHYISNQVVVVVHYIFQAILVVVVNTNILSTITPLHLFVRNWMKMTFLDIFNFENLRHLAVVNELRLIFILIQ